MRADDFVSWQRVVLCPYGGQEKLKGEIRVCDKTREGVTTFCILTQENNFGKYSRGKGFSYLMVMMLKKPQTPLNSLEQIYYKSHRTQ